MHIKEIVLDGRQMTDPEATHHYLAKMLDFPDYYGKNLDALYDCLTDIDSHTALVLEHTGAMRAALGDYAPKLLATLQDAAERNTCLDLVGEP